jgi:Histidine ammonia-lyase
MNHVSMVADVQRPSLLFFQKILFSDAKLTISSAALQKVQESYQFLASFVDNKIIYGVNTGFGPMARYRIPDSDLKALQYNLIRSHCTGVGAMLEPQYVKAAMLCRLLNILKGGSGIHPEAAVLLTECINRDIIPVLYEHGSVGASGDLVQLAHLALCLIGEGEVRYQGGLRPAAEVLAENGLKPISIHIREGLSLINGTSVMTGIGLMNIIYARQLLAWGVAASAMINEIVDAYDDSFSAGLNKAKAHIGQEKVAAEMRKILEGSKMIRRRGEGRLYTSAPSELVFEERVQEYYSLRCVPQILGPVWDTLAYAQEVLLRETDSVNDNPVVDVAEQTVLHGGNFHGDYISLEMDKLKIAITRLTMLMERQLNFILNPKLNEKFPPFVNLGTPGIQLGMQAAQFTATSTTAESQTLCFPNYVHSIPNNNDNQDIVSMGTNSAQLCKKVIENGFEVLAIYMIAIIQAIETISNKEDMAPDTLSIYRRLREVVPAFVEDTTKHREIAAMKSYLRSHSIGENHEC